MPTLDKRKIKYNAVVYEKTCTSCGVTFYAKRPSAIYCSDLCRVHAYLLRKKEKESVKMKKKIFYSKNEIENELLRLSGKKMNINIEFYTFPEKRYKEITINNRQYTVYRIGRSQYCLKEN